MPKDEPLFITIQFGYFPMQSFWKAIFDHAAYNLPYQLRRQINELIFLLKRIEFKK